MTPNTPLLEGQTPMNTVDAQNNTFTSTMNVPGGLSTLKSQTIGDIAEVPEESPLKVNDSVDKDKERKITEKSEGRGSQSNLTKHPSNMIRNPSELNVPVPADSSAMG
jgi:hypothetical protein